MKLDGDFWNNRYAKQETGWDIGSPSTPIKEYIDQLKNKKIRILIPGCGNAYEAEYLHKKGFTNVFLLDIAPLALAQFLDRVASFPKAHCIEGDFFEHSASYDLILEQTFFCALNKNLRPNYVQQMRKLLSPKGKLVGLLFSENFNNEHPPYGGTLKEYQSLFKNDFHIQSLAPAYNSIPPRRGIELFIQLSPFKKGSV